MIAAVHSFERRWKQVFAVTCHARHVMSHEGFSDSGTRVFIKYFRMKYGSLFQKFYQSDKRNIKCFNVMSFKPGLPRPNHRQSDLDLFMFYRPTLSLNSCKLLSTGRWSELLFLRYISNDQINLTLNKKVTSQKDGCVGGWLLALPRAQITRPSRILGIWFTYYVSVLWHQANTFVSRTRASIYGACWVLDYE